MIPGVRRRPHGQPEIAGAGGGTINKALRYLAIIFISTPLLGVAQQRCGQAAKPAQEAPAARGSASPARGEAKRVSTLEQGTWGGRGVALRVTAGGAEVEFDCAHGEIKGRIELDAEGRFDVAGTFVTEGGPSVAPSEGRADEKSARARYVGRVEGKKMTLSVRLPEAEGGPDALTLTHGQEPNLVKCY